MQKMIKRTNPEGILAENIYVVQSQDVNKTEY